MTIDSIYRSGPVAGITKSPAIWAHNDEHNCAWPLVYMHKPRSTSDEDYNVALDAIKKMWGKS